MSRAPLALLATLGLAAALLAQGRPGSAPAAPRWWKGNTHTHTLWSDGDAPPEPVVAWYREHGYHFLVLSDHNVLQEGERWFPIRTDDDARLRPEQVQALRERFGADAFETREVEAGPELRLATLSRLKARFEAPGEFLLMPGEEITTNWRSPDKRVHEVHVNALNVVERIAPRGSNSVPELLQEVLDSVQRSASAHHQPMLAHVNHPNFRWSLTWQDLAGLVGERFFEVHNGHRAVNNGGDDEHLGTEAMWDRANALRVTELGLPLLFGLGTDDAHDHHGGLTSPPGRAWIVVRAASLDPTALLDAMELGDFYASSGVELRDVRIADGRYTVEHEPVEGETLTTRFLGLRQGGEPGALLLETTDNPAVYPFTDTDVFVRAVVTSTRPHPNPCEEGEPERAWTQPSARR